MRAPRTIARANPFRTPGRSGALAGLIIYWARSTPGTASRIKPRATAGAWLEWDVNFNPLTLQNYP
jgi:hypothetical protein